MLGREHVNYIAAHAKGTPRKVHVIALVLHADQPSNHIALTHLVSHARNKSHLRVVLWRANAVNSTNGGHNDRVAPLQHAFGG